LHLFAQRRGAHSETRAGNLDHRFYGAGRRAEQYSNPDESFFASDPNLDLGSIGQSLEERHHSALGK
jgi:hypothetical protein